MKITQEKFRAEITKLNTNIDVLNERGNRLLKDMSNDEIVDYYKRTEFVKVSSEVVADNVDVYRYIVAQVEDELHDEPDAEDVNAFLIDLDITDLVSELRYLYRDEEADVLGTDEQLIKSVKEDIFIEISER